MKKELLQIANLLRHWKRTRYIARDPKFRQERETAEIIRLVHSLEKGLSLENPRLGFGVKKIHSLLDRCESYVKAFGDGADCLLMAYDAVAEYIAFHRQKGYAHEEFTEICGRFEALSWGGPHDGKYGGTLRVDGAARQLTFEQLCEFFASRHSVRDFKEESVSEEELYEAVRAAQLAPSACNRQAVRAYVLPSAKVSRLYGGSMEGIGGFAQDADKFILITGKVSAYRMSEYDQHVVSAGIFAAYLTLALHAKNIGSCIVQRPLQYSKQWQRMSRECGIPEDEQLVLMIAIGRSKDQYTAPVSKRFSTETILKMVKD